MKTSSGDLGDFQTPPSLVSAVLARLGPAAMSARRVLEPACGTGAFLDALLRQSSSALEVKAFELQPERLAVAARLIDNGDGHHVELSRANIFDVDLQQLRWDVAGPLLVIGNPPWIMSSTLGALNSTNVPRKRNIRGLRGMDARTGSSNFDLTEHIWFKLLTELVDQQPTIALLSKTSVARRVLDMARALAIPVADARLFRLDARKWFGASVDACLFMLSVRGVAGRYEVAIYDSLDAPEPSSRMGFIGDSLVNDVSRAGALDLATAHTSLVWRQGVKHDVAAVMELRRTDAGYRNGLEELVDIEPEVVYPLLKSSDLNNWPAARHRAVVITQRTLNETPELLARTAPRAWQYLSSHAEYFDRRRSSVYRGRPRFSMFGVGPYSFFDYKIAIAGLYSQARFRLIGPQDDRPVLLDDTCYFVPVETAVDGALLSAALNHPQNMEVLRALSFSDSKRPITKKVLQRLDPHRILLQIGADALSSAAEAELARAGCSPATASWTEVAERLMHRAQPELFIAAS